MIILDKHNLRTITKDQLVSIAAVAEAREYNRQLSMQGLRDVDPVYVGLVSPVLIHEHAQGIKVEPHWRCDCLLKFKGDEEPISVMLDIPMDMFEELERVPMDVVDANLPESRANEHMHEDGTIRQNKPVV